MAQPESLTRRLRTKRQSAEEAMAMVGTRGRRQGRATLTVREKKLIRNYNHKTASRSERALMRGIYAKTKKSQDERVASAKRRSRR